MNFKDNDPVTVLQSIMDMALSITAEVYDTILESLDNTQEDHPESEAAFSEIKDKLNMCSVYVDQGIITIATTALCVYGAAAPETPKFMLKGSGDIVLKADKLKGIYVSKNTEVGSPAGAIHETVDTIAFGLRFGMETARLVKDGVKLIEESGSIGESKDKPVEFL